MKPGFVRYWLIAVLLAIFATAAAPAQAQWENSPPIGVEMLRNATYSGIYDAPITLTDGRYEGEPFVAGGASRPVVEYVDGAELFADLDGDGVEDAVVFLVERGGGTAAFTYVAAQLNRAGEPVDAGAVLVEDRTQVLSAVVEEGQLKLEFTTLGASDASCCPSHKAQRTYAVQDGGLAIVADHSQELITLPQTSTTPSGPWSNWARTNRRWRMRRSPSASRRAKSADLAAATTTAVRST